MEEKNNRLPHSDHKEEREVWEDILNNPVKSLTPENEKHFLEELYYQIGAHERKKKLRKFRIYGSVAATLLLAIIGLIGYNTFYKPDIYLAEAQNSEIKLADGSLVVLSKGGKLTVEKSFPADTRDVFLEGDAVFNVRKSKRYPFIVHGKDYQTKVLGTVFKVMQDGKTFTVELFEGKVAVKKTAAEQEYYLTPNQTFSNYGKRDIAAVIPLKTDETAAANKAAGKSDDELIRLSFSGTSVKNAIEVVEETYHIKVEYPAEYAGHTITIDKKNVSAENALQSIALYLNLKLNINDQTYRLEP